MGDKVVKVLIFATGVVVGSIMTARLIKDKYEKIAEDEIADMRDYYNEKRKKLSDLTEDTVSEEKTSGITDEEKEEYDRQLTNYNKMFESGEETKNVAEDNDDEESDDDEDDGITLLHPQEFGTLDDYETAFLEYYTDGYVIDEFGDVVDDPEKILGKEALGSIGKYSEDVIHVRNESEMTDFEVLKIAHDYKS